MPAMRAKGSVSGGASHRVGPAITSDGVRHLLATDPAQAEARAREMLVGAPQNPGALLMLGAALHRQGNAKDAAAILEPLARSEPQMAAVHFELGWAFSDLVRKGEATASLMRAIDLDPDNTHAWQLLGEELEVSEGGAAAEPFRCATSFFRQKKLPQAIAELNRALQYDPHNPLYRHLKASLLVQMGEFAEGAAEFEILLKHSPQLPGAWMAYAHALRTLGRFDECLAAYRKTTALLPGLSEAWWSLANLKTYRFEPAEVDALRDALARPNLQGKDIGILKFALGKVLEDAGRYAESFECYGEANRILGSTLSYDSDETTERIQRTKTRFTRDFFRDRAGWGCKAVDPIFIIGLPRSGSTLVEQILASHSAIEGTAELNTVNYLAGRIADAAGYPEGVRELSAQQLETLGDEYIARTRSGRKLGRPYFTDKMPNNFMHVGFIHLMLPRAKIIDVRRHPLGCCFSNFKQHYWRGLSFAYTLTDIGRYYRDYVELMAHFDDVLPGKVYHLSYELLVKDTPKEVRQLLEFLALPFEDNCLRFYETERAVWTVSSEQVRSPIFEHALDHWRNYEQWLDPLKAALGPVLDAYGEVSSGPPGHARAAETTAAADAAFGAD